MRYKLYIVVTFLLALASAPAPAATWWRLPVWGSEVRLFAVDPFESNRVYCGTSRGNFYGSTDGGATWVRTGAETEGLAQVESLAFDPSDPKTLYAGTWRQAFRTRDGGETWTRIAEGMV